MERLKETLDELGISLDRYIVEKTSKGYRVSTREIHEIPKTPNDSYGMLAVRANGKPTSFFARAMYKRIKKKVNVSIKELGDLLEGKAIPFEGHGWYLVMWDDIPVGVARVSKDGLVLEMPKDDVMRARAGFKRILQK